VSPLQNLWVPYRTKTEKLGPILRERQRQRHLSKREGHIGWLTVMIAPALVPAAGSLLSRPNVPIPQPAQSTTPCGTDPRQYQLSGGTLQPCVYTLLKVRTFCNKRCELTVASATRSYPATVGMPEQSSHAYPCFVRTQCRWQR